MSLSHIVVTLCLIVDVLLAVVLLGDLRHPALPDGALPPRARRQMQLLSGILAAFAILFLAMLVLLLWRGVELVPSEGWSVLATLYLLVVLIRTRLARRGRIV
jgi:hypothetical protein